MRSSVVAPLALLVAFSTTEELRAQGEEQIADQAWRRFHVGVAVGTSHLGPDLSSSGAPPEILDRFGDRSPPSTNGWKVVAGFRPTRMVGVEIQYVDFGTAEIEPPTGNAIVRTHVDMESSADAWVLTALLFIPDRAPSFDFYGKVGMANLDESVQAHALLVGPPCTPFACNFNADVDQTELHPYFGIGFRRELGRAVAFRAEYEAIDRDDGDYTTLFSVGVAWER